jgi:hypothetical protein
MALIGLMQTLGLEGEKYGIHVNAVAPTAATQMTVGLVPEDELRNLAPECVSPAVVFLASEVAPNRSIVCAGAGSFERAYISVTHGAFIGSEAEAPDVDFNILWPKFQQSMATDPRKASVDLLRL